MVLQKIPEMFSALIKIFQKLHSLLSPSYGEATTRAENILSNAPPQTRTKMKALAKGVAEKFGNLKFAKNVDKQELGVLKKKERLANHISKKSKRFWKWGKKRLNQRLSPTAKEDLKVEQSALQHLAADEKEIKTEFKKTRKHDLQPLLKKVSHHIKILIIEAKKGAVDIELLKQLILFENELLKKINQEEAYQQQVEQDEFKMMKLLKSELIKEGSDLRKQLKETEDQKEQNQIKKRIKQILAEVYILQHALHLAEKEDINEQLLKEKAVKIYGIIEMLKKVAAQQQALEQQAQKENKRRIQDITAKINKFGKIPKKGTEEYLEWKKLYDEAAKLRSS